MGEPLYFSVEELKVLRQRVDEIYRNLEKGGTHKATELKLYEPESKADLNLESTAYYQASVKLIEAKMWLGKMIEGLGAPFPPHLADNGQSAPRS